MQEDTAEETSGVRFVKATGRGNRDIDGQEARTYQGRTSGQKEQLATEA
jgi:hypothetical protein